MSAAGFWAESGVAVSSAGSHKVDNASQSRTRQLPRSVSRLQLLHAQPLSFAVAPGIERGEAAAPHQVLVLHLQQQPSSKVHVAGADTARALRGLTTAAFSATLSDTYGTLDSSSDGFGGAANGPPHQQQQLAAMLFHGNTLVAQYSWPLPSSTTTACVTAALVLPPVAQPSVLQLVLVQQLLVHPAALTGASSSEQLHSYSGQWGNSTSPNVQQACTSSVAFARVPLLFLPREAVQEVEQNLLPAMRAEAAASQQQQQLQQPQLAPITQTAKNVLLEREALVFHHLCSLADDIDKIWELGTHVRAATTTLGDQGLTDPAVQAALLPLAQLLPGVLLYMQQQRLPHCCAAVLDQLPAAVAAPWQQWRRQQEALLEQEEQEQQWQEADDSIQRQPEVSFSGWGTAAPPQVERPAPDAPSCVRQPGTSIHGDRHVTAPEGQQLDHTDLCDAFSSAAVEAAAAAGRQDGGAAAEYGSRAKPDAACGLPASAPTAAALAGVASAVGASTTPTSAVADWVDAAAAAHAAAATTVSAAASGQLADSSFKAPNALDVPAFAACSSGPRTAAVSAKVAEVAAAASSAAAGHGAGVVNPDSCSGSTLQHQQEQEKQLCEPQHKQQQQQLQEQEQRASSSSSLRSLSMQKGVQQLQTLPQKQQQVKACSMLGHVSSSKQQSTQQLQQLKQQQGLAVSWSTSWRYFPVPFEEQYVYWKHRHYLLFDLVSAGCLGLHLVALVMRMVVEQDYAGYLLYLYFIALRLLPYWPLVAGRLPLFLRWREPMIAGVSHALCLLPLVLRAALCEGSLGPSWAAAVQQVLPSWATGLYPTACNMQGVLEPAGTTVGLGLLTPTAVAHTAELQSQAAAAASAEALLLAEQACRLPGSLCAAVALPVSGMQAFWRLRGDLLVTALVPLTQRLRLRYWVLYLLVELLMLCYPFHVAFSLPGVLLRLSTAAVVATAAAWVVDACSRAAFARQLAQQQQSKLALG